MDKLLPPPNDSLEEIQAWNNMMDSIVAFFKACSHLMNIITNRVNAEFRGSYPKQGIRLSEIIGGFEPEYQLCRPRSPCGICGRERRVLSRGPSGTASEAEKSVLRGGGGNKCTCAKIKVKRFEEQKGKCRSSRHKPYEQKEDEHPSEKHPVEVICGWDATPGRNRMSMVMKKLGAAQQKVSHLQEEQMKLQKMDASKKITPHGGPNPEILYREIMKDNTGMAASQRSLGPSRGRPYPPRIPEVLPPGREARRPFRGGFDKNNLILDSSTGRSGMRTPVMPLARSRGARRYCPAHFYSPHSPPSIDAPSPFAADIDRIALSSQSSMESFSTPNFFFPGVYPCIIRTREFYSTQSSTSSSQPSVETLSQEYRKISPNPAYWSRLAVYGDSDAEDQMGCALH